MLKMALLAAMPSAMVATAMAKKPGDRNSVRSAYRKVIIGAPLYQGAIVTDRPARPRQPRKTRCAGEPTGVYCPVNVRRPDPRSIRKLAIASDRWLHENRNRPPGSIVKLRG